MITMNRYYYNAFLFIVLIGVLATVFIGPSYDTIKILLRSLHENRQELQARKLAIAKITDLNTQYAEKEKEILKTQDFLPNNGPHNVPDLLIELEGLALQSGLSLQNISFSQEQKGAGKDKDKKSERAYHTIQARFSVSGSYTNMKHFITAVGINKHLMDIVTLTVGASQSGEQRVSLEDISVSSQSQALLNAQVALDAYYQ